MANWNRGLTQLQNGGSFHSFLYVFCMFILKMAIEIVDLPINNINSMVIFHSYVSLPEGNGILFPASQFSHPPSLEVESLCSRRRKRAFWSKRRVAWRSILRSGTFKTDGTYLENSWILKWNICIYIYIYIYIYMYMYIYIYIYIYI